MILYKTLDREEILEWLAMLIVSRLPRDVNGDIEVSYNDDDGVDITVLPKIKSGVVN